MMRTNATHRLDANPACVEPGRSVGVVVCDDHDDAGGEVGDGWEAGLAARAECGSDRLGLSTLVSVVVLVVHRGRRDRPAGVVTDFDHCPSSGPEIPGGTCGQAANGAVVVDPHLATAEAFVTSVRQC